MNIIWSAPLDASGYSSCAREYMLALYDNNVNVQAYAPIVSQAINGMGIDSNLKKKMDSIQTNTINDNYIYVSHSIPERFVIDKKALLNIGYTVVETEKIPPKWTFLCNKMDGIFTASTFSKNILKSNGVSVPIFVIPHCHNFEEYSNVEKYNIDNLRRINFLFMADMTPRKGWETLIRAYCKAFNPKDDVTLTMKVYYHNFSEESQNKCKERIKNVAQEIGHTIGKTSAPILFYGDCLPNNCITKFINSFDCTISPHRAEAWGLVLSQSMLLEKIAVGTDYSGNLEFMDKNNSVLLKIKGFEPICDEMININPNYANNEWPIIDESYLQEKLTDIYSDTEKYRSIAEKGKIDIKEKYNYSIVSKIITKAINELLLKKGQK
jgi:glycosyltransferase involved in cell wall biosynthesis